MTSPGILLNITYHLKHRKFNIYSFLHKILIQNFNIINITYYICSEIGIGSLGMSRFGCLNLFL